jgi:hypothetical protein
MKGIESVRNWVGANSVSQLKGPLEGAKGQSGVQITVRYVHGKCIMCMLHDRLTINAANFAVHWSQL